MTTRQNLRIIFAPLVLVYWPKSYPKLFGNRHSWPRDPFDPAHVVSGWTHSLLFTPRALLVLVPLAVVGLLRVRSRYAAALLVAWIALNAVFYSLYRVTWEHPPKEGPNDEDMDVVNLDTLRGLVGKKK